MVPVGRTPVGIAIAPDGEAVYVANSSSNTVSVVDTATYKVTATVPVGKRPNHIGIIPPPQCVPFSGMCAKLSIALSRTPSEDAFGLLSGFTLGSASNGIDLVTRPVTLQAGTFTATIPPGSFTKSPSGTYTFTGMINGVNLEVVIQPLGGKRFTLEASALNANLSGTENPVTVRLTVGNDCGPAVAEASNF
jgi:YVTN family beta-propeller protein